MRDFVYITALLLIATIFIVYHPLANFSANPPYWGDEAVAVEKARNFIDYGKLDIMVAPGEMSNKLYATAAAGPLLTLPLAAFLYYFGVGIFQVRIFMVIWIFALLILIYFIVKKITDRKTAALTILLIATFSPFYANGKTSTGDIPGFFALMIALYVFVIKRKYVLSGILFALAGITKPSLYLLAAGIPVLEILYNRNERYFKNVMLYISGFMLVCVPWLYSIIPDVSSFSSWLETYAFFRNPFPDKGGNFISLLFSDPAYVLNSTLLHYLFLISIVFAAFLKMSDKNSVVYRFISFSLTYSIIALVLYMRSPGWLRYLIAGELLMFIVLVPSVRELLRTFRKTELITFIIVGALVFTQGVHYMFYSWRSASWATGQTVTALNAILAENDSIGFINELPSASLINSKNKFQTVRISGNTILGRNPLLNDVNLLPSYVLTTNKSDSKELLLKHKKVLDIYYKETKSPHNAFVLYKKVEQ